MSLQIWLPLIKDVQNQGICGDILTSSGVVFTNGGKLGEKYLSAGTITIPAKISKTFFNKNNMSFAFWLYPIGSSSSSIIMGQTPMSAGNNRMYSIFQYPTPNDLHLSWQDETATSTTFLVGAWNGFFQANVWTHCCITYNGNKAIIYRNGERYGSSNGISNRSVFEYDYPIVGNSLRKLQDVRIYDHCLSPLEVKQISQGLILHYPLNRNGWGQENLITGYDTSFLSYPDGAVTLFSNQMNGGVQEIVSNIEGATKCLHLHNNGGNGRQYKMFSANSGKSYTISCDYYSTSSQGFPFRGELNGGNYSWAGSNAAAYTTPNKWVRLSFSYLNLTSTATLYYFMQCSKDTDCYIKNLKIEEGSIATPWCPNSSDALAITLGLNDNIQYDTSGYGNNGTKIGTFSYASDTPKYNVSTSFNGSAKIERDSLMGEIYTLSCWAKTTKNKSTSQMIVVDSNSQIAIAFYNGTIIGVYGTTRSTGSKCTLSDSNYKENEWNHFVVVKTSNDGKRNIYCNGELLTPSSDDYWSSAPNNFAIGARNTSTPFYFYGEISDVRAYATALSAEDVKSLYNNSAYIDNQGNIYGAIYEEV